MPIERLLDRVAGRAGDIGNDCPFLAQKRIQQGALAGIRRAYNRHRNAVLDGVSAAERIRQTDYMGQCLFYQCP